MHQVDERVGEACESGELEAGLVGHARAALAGHEAELVDGLDLAVAAAQHQTGRRLEGRDLVVERQRASREAHDHAEAAPEPDLAPGQPLRGDDARIPRLRVAEVGQVGEGLLGGQGQVDRIDVAGHGLLSGWDGRAVGYAGKVGQT